MNLLADPLLNSKGFLRSTVDFVSALTGLLLSSLAGCAADNMSALRPADEVLRSGLQSAVADRVRRSWQPVLGGVVVLGL